MSVEADNFMGHQVGNIHEEYEAKKSRPPLMTSPVLRIKSDASDRMRLNPDPL